MAGKTRMGQPVIIWSYWEIVPLLQYKKSLLLDILKNRPYVIIIKKITKIIGLSKS